MKKFLLLFSVAIISLHLFSCGENPEDKAQSAISSVKTIEELDELMEKDVDETIKTLEDKFYELSSELNTYDKYENNIDKVEEFYDRVINDINLLCIRLREYSVGYANIILNSDNKPKEMRDDIDIIRKSVYDDACDEIRKKIYDNLFDDMRDAFYDGVIRKAKESISYEEYDNARSKAYKMRDDARYEVYHIRDDARYDIYHFRDDLKSKLYDEDIDGAEKCVEDFQKDIDKLYASVLEK